MWFLRYLVRLLSQRVKQKISVAAPFHHQLNALTQGSSTFFAQLPFFGKCGMKPLPERINVIFPIKSGKAQKKTAKVLTSAELHFSTEIR